jgi:hypothetical protein
VSYCRGLKRKSGKEGRRMPEEVEEGGTLEKGRREGGECWTVLKEAGGHF